MRQAWEVDIAASTLILTQTGEEESRVGQHWYVQEVNKQEPGELIEPSVNGMDGRWQVIGLLL